MVLTYYIFTNKQNPQNSAKLPIGLAFGSTKFSSLTYCGHQSCRNVGERKRHDTNQAED